MWIWSILVVDTRVDMEYSGSGGDSDLDLGPCFAIPGLLLAFRKSFLF